VRPSTVPHFIVGLRAGEQGDGARDVEQAAFGFTRAFARSVDVVEFLDLSRTVQERGGVFIRANVTRPEGVPTLAAARRLFATPCVSSSKSRRAKSDLTSPT
jgi:hypothetical protein